MLDGHPNGDTGKGSSDSDLEAEVERVDGDAPAAESKGADVRLLYVARRFRHSGFDLDVLCSP